MDSTIYKFAPVSSQDGLGVVMASPIWYKMASESRWMTKAALKPQAAQHWIEVPGTPRERVEMLQSTDQT